MRIDEMLNDAISANEIPGAVAIVVRDGKIVYHKAFGMADNQKGRVLKVDDIFRLASQTKAITSTAVMMLWEEGRFKLDDPISKYIPEFGNPQILESFDEADSSYTTTAAEKQITIRHLLTHTSGLGYGYIDQDPRMRKIYNKAGIIEAFTTEDITLEENIKKLAVLPLHHTPGEDFTYGMGIDVLGYLVEVLSGMPLDNFFRERIFEPLGMNHTGFYLPETIHERLVEVQTKNDKQWVKYPASFYDPDFPIKGAARLFSGGAGLSGTAQDYAIFLQMYLNQGEYNGIRLLSRTTVEFMMENQLDNLPNAQSHGLAFGLVNSQQQSRGGNGSEGSFHWGGYFNSTYFADPKEKVIGVLLKQTMDIPYDNTDWKFAILVGQAIDD